MNHTGGACTGHATSALFETCLFIYEVLSTTECQQSSHYYKLHIRMNQDLAELLRRVNEAEAKAAEADAKAAEADAKAAEADAKAAEADAKAAEADAKAAEERRLREEAEADSKHSKPQNLLEYLTNCHQSFHTPTIVTDKSSTTQGNTTDPTNRQFPQRIVPWPDFLSEQDGIWELISTHSELGSRKVFPSLHQLDYVRKNLAPISSENDVRYYARETIENHVQTLVREICEDEQIRDAIGLRGKVYFENHTNMGNAGQSTIEEDMEHMVIARSTRAKTRERARDQETNKRRRLAKDDGSSGSGRRKVGPSDRFCILELPGGGKTPFMAIEYKPPHKFSLDNMIAGLNGEIRPAEDVINQEAKSFEASSKALVAAVITQLFSDMIRKGLLWGYTCTAVGNIFLHIPGEPSVVYCHLSIPTLDCQKDDENREYRTAVAQVSAFVLRAMNTVAPSQSWRDEAEKLPVWPVEYLDILKDIPPTPEPSESNTKGSEYTKRLREAYIRSPIVTRRTSSKQSCKEAGDDQGKSNRDSHEDGDPETPDTPSRPQNRGKGWKQGAANTQRADTETRGGADKRGGRQKQITAISRPNIKNRPYCSHRCLLGLAYGGAMDEKCPNIQDHPRKHITQKTFLRLIRNQLATDRGSDADCTELYIKGARGALFKVRLSSYGYTVVAKGVEQHNAKYLDHEQKIYEHIRSIQGTLVPVCLGSVPLKRPQYFEDGKYVKMLFLSWAGRSLVNCPDQNKRSFYLIQMQVALQKLHQLQVLHKDAESRNILWDEQSQSFMFIDFERAELCTRQPLGNITPNRKRKRGTENQKQPTVDDFDLELRRAVFHFSRSLES
jgi:hypothetical protein